MRRTIVCSLDPKVERPELRRFTTEDPVKRASRDRPKYVTAILTILRAFHVAGRPNQGLQPLGSFESWSDLVRSALVWLGEPDPCRTMESTRAEDPHSRGLSAVLYGWHEAVGDRELTAKRAIEYASEPEGGSCTWKVKHPEFREALLAVAGDRGEISVLRLGKWLGKMKGKVVDGLRIEIGAVNRGEQRWRVVRI